MSGEQYLDKALADYQEAALAALEVVADALDCRRTGRLLTDEMLVRLDDVVFDCAMQSRRVMRVARGVGEDRRKARLAAVST